MSLSHCESYCFPPMCFPCLRKSKDAPSVAVSAAPPAVAAEGKPPPVQKIEVDDEEEEGDDDGDEKTAVAPAARRKSNLKKGSCAEGECAAKGNVKWLDLLGKDLTEVKEFEPSESGDSMDDEDGNAACVCVIQ